MVLMKICNLFIPCTFQISLAGEDASPAGVDHTPFDEDNRKKRTSPATTDDERACILTYERPLAIEKKKAKKISLNMKGVLLHVMADALGKRW